MNEIQVQLKKHYNIFFVGNNKLDISGIQAEKIMEALTKPDTPKFIRIGDELFATHQIARISINKNII